MRSSNLVRNNLPWASVSGYGAAPTVSIGDYHPVLHTSTTSSQGSLQKSQCLDNTVPASIEKRLDDLKAHPRKLS